jgi:hypothetical protein
MSFASNRQIKSPHLIASGKYFTLRAPRMWKTATNILEEEKERAGRPAHLLYANVQGSL